jgi:magnesium transporter
VADTRVEILRRLARRGVGSALQRALVQSRPEAIAAAISHLAPDEQRLVMAHIDDDEVAAGVLSAVEESDLLHLVRDLPFDRLVILLNEMDVDDEADVIDRLPEELRDNVLQAIQDADKELVEDILAWPQDSAGGIMQPIAFRLNESLTCRTAISELHRQHEDLETVFYIYVENDAGHLVGVVSLRALLTHSPSSVLKQIMSSDLISVAPQTDQEEVARLVSRYDLLALPVVDENRCMLGIVTIDDVVDVLMEEAHEDMMLMAGVADELEPESVSSFKAARQRFNWLIVTLLGGIIMAEMIGSFENALAQQAVLAGFIPVMLGMGGNVGIQAATVAVRNIATGNLRQGGLGPTLLRETRVGFLLGIAFALTLGGYAIVKHTVGSPGWEHPMLAASIALSIVLTVVGAAALGSLVPHTLHRLNVDPAIATGPFVTTLIDVLAIMIYFTTSMTLLGI